jgi:hypothetical protein
LQQEKVLFAENQQRSGVEGKGGSGDNAAVDEQGSAAIILLRTSGAGQNRRNVVEGERGRRYRQIGGRV